MVEFPKNDLAVETGNIRESFAAWKMNDFIVAFSSLMHFMRFHFSHMWHVNLHHSYFVFVWIFVSELEPAIVTPTGGEYLDYLASDVRPLETLQTRFDVVLMATNTCTVFAIDET